jgi:hypothetical protein
MVGFNVLLKNTLSATLIIFPTLIESPLREEVYGGSFFPRAEKAQKHNNKISDV